MAVIYTVEEHVRRLELMLDICGRPCNACPAGKRFDSTGDPDGAWDISNRENHPCYICQAFLDLRPVLDEIGICPCLRLGQRALHVTDEKIAEHYREAMK